MIEKEDLPFLKNTKLTKNSIVEKFGFPTIVLSDEQWLYIAQKVEYKAFLKPVILSTKVVKINFDKNGNYKISYFEPIINSIVPLSDSTIIKEESLSFISQLKKNVQNMGK